MSDRSHHVMKSWSHTDKWKHTNKSYDSRSGYYPYRLGQDKYHRVLKNSSYTNTQNHNNIVNSNSGSKNGHYFANRYEQNKQFDWNHRDNNKKSSYFDKRKHRYSDIDNNISKQYVTSADNLRKEMSGQNHGVIKSYSSDVQQKYHYDVNDNNNSTDAINFADILLEKKATDQIHDVTKNSPYSEKYEHSDQAIENNCFKQGVLSANTSNEDTKSHKINFENKNFSHNDKEKHKNNNTFKESFNSAVSLKKDNMFDQAHRVMNPDSTEQKYKKNLSTNSVKPDVSFADKLGQILNDLGIPSLSNACFVPPVQIQYRGNEVTSDLKSMPLFDDGRFDPAVQKQCPGEVLTDFKAMPLLDDPSLSSVCFDSQVRKQGNVQNDFRSMPVLDDTSYRTATHPQKSKEAVMIHSSGKENKTLENDKSFRRPTIKKPTGNIALVDCIILNKARTYAKENNAVVSKKFPTLSSLASEVVKKNLIDYGYTGGVSYSTLKPILIKVNSDQLTQIENKNQYLVNDSDEIWRQNCHKKFRGRKPWPHETWRDMFKRCQQERESRIK